MGELTRRSVLIANILSRILALLSFTLVIILLLLFGPGINTPIIVGIGIFFLCIPLINSYRPITGRMILALIGPVLTVVAALLPKIFETSFTDILYYDARFILILFSIVPCLIFDVSEWKSTYICLALIFLLIEFFDPLHELLHVGYYQKGFSGRSYYYINYITGLTFFGITAGAMVLRRIVHQSEAQAASYLEELQANQEQLMEANALISNQKVELEKAVNEATINLRKANQELLRHNDEITAFSYAISHRLRAPIARMLGLVDIIDIERPSWGGDLDDILEKLKNSGLEIDTVVRDLNSILTIHQSADVTTERIDFSSLWLKTKSALEISDTMELENFDIDFSQAPSIISVRSMVYSIFLNLISNSLRYRSFDRDLRASVRTQVDGDFIVLTVRDNGIGFDVERVRNDMFKMYKTFDGERYGKGLGLYLIKSQTEFLNGTVVVESRQKEGTVVVVRLPLNH
ncbi:HAMP domain-containing sensor histidine kinase [Chryseolinea sp. T2]|uniref:sensor histidine kinase n=1 Tax=Chryseolinea sp. T2 TaxID=3129255 RepID=UPI0030781E90